MILGIDVGGTHTDAVLIDRFRVLNKAKVLTDERNLLTSLLAVTNELIDESNVRELERVVLSTTISTNAIVQNKVDRVGMVVVSGPGLPPCHYDVNQDTYFLSGCINHRGIEITRIDRKEALQMRNRFRSEGIHHAGIVGKFSTRNPRQEVELAEIVGEELHRVKQGGGPEHDGVAQRLEARQVLREADPVEAHGQPCHQDGCVEVQARRERQAEDGAEQRERVHVTTSPPSGV